MSNHLSISSSNPLKKMSQPLKVALFTLFILFCVGISLFLYRGSLEKMSSKSPLSSIYSYLDLNNPKDIQIIFLGTSRTFSCIKKDLLAKKIGIKESNILILQISGGSCWEELSICRKYPKLFDSCPLVIIEIEPWMFNKNYFSDSNNIYIQPGFFAWSTFQDRLDFPDIKMKFLLLADYFWPFSERRSIDKWADILYSLVTGRQPPSYNPNEIPAFHYNMSALKILRDDPKATALFQAHAGLNNYTFAEYKAEYLSRLIHLLENRIPNGTKDIVLLQPPLRNAYFNILYNNPQYANGYKQVIRFIHSLENEHVHSIIWQAPEDCGMNDSIFIDYGHFNVNGAYIFTGRLLDELKGLGLTNSNATGGTGINNSAKDNSTGKKKL